MSKLRSVNTHFWDDNYIIDLDPIEKLLFLYLLTNPNTNMLGIYELHIRKISFETGIDKDMVLKIFERFHTAGRASYIKGYVCLHNFTKHQAYNDNMKKSAIKSFNELPEVIKTQEFIEELLKALKPLPKGSEPIAEYELEVEGEYESEYEYSPLISNFTSLQKMEDPLTVEEGERLVQEFGRDTIMDVLQKMENWKGIEKKNKSTNLTARNWIKRDGGNGQQQMYDNHPLRYAN